jgi:polysaccharide biosynthesis/export protein
VTLGVEEYTSNQVTVLGRVANAGIQRFPHPPTLAEVLANAGALPILDKQATLTRCAIMRGRDKMIWVDLKALLNGELGYNIRMKKGDIGFYSGFVGHLGICAGLGPETWFLPLDAAHDSA